MVSFFESANIPQKQKYTDADKEYRNRMKHRIHKSSLSEQSPDVDGNAENLFSRPQLFQILLFGRFNVGVSVYEAVQRLRTAVHFIVVGAVGKGGERCFSA